MRVDVRDEDPTLAECEADLDEWIAERAAPDLANCRYSYRERRCLIPGCHGETCFCHWPKHRGMGGRNAGWAYDEGVPLCRIHHDRLDGRGETWALHIETLEMVRKLAPAFWESVKAAHE